MDCSALCSGQVPVTPPADDETFHGIWLFVPARYAFLAMR
jgi:hypothetical protein